MFLEAHTHLSANSANYSGAAGRGALTPLLRVPTTASIASFALKVNRTLLAASAAGNTVGLDSVFTKDYPPLPYPCKLPGPNERLINTQQLALCLHLLQSLPLSDYDVLTPSARTWLTVTEKNSEEQERLKAIAAGLISAYSRNEVKGSKVTAEVVCLAPFLEKEDYRILLSQLVNGIEGSLLLDIRALEGLVQLLQGASPGYLDADDLVKILRLLSNRLQETHGKSPQHVYKLTATIAQVLDAMVDCNVVGLDRVNLHEPLLSYLEALKSNRDPYMVFQAAYAYQALLFIPDNENNWQAALRRSGGLLSVRQGRVGGLSGYKGVKALMESGQSLQDALKTSNSFSQKRDWYPLLRGIDYLLRNGELIKFKTLVCGAPCRRDLAFLWGVCQGLGDLASDSRWETDARQGAIAFLGEIYKNDAEWGQEPQIKQCILDILLRLASVSGVVDQGND
jgi:hypothetical protein